jgi:hypothetical protein
MQTTTTACRRLSRALIAALAVSLGACAAGDDELIEPADTLEAVTVEPPPPPPAPPLNPVIRSDGIGAARIGMRIADLRRSLPDGVTLGESTSFMVDIDALPVVQGSDTLYYVLSMAGDEPSDNAMIELLATTHTAFRTGQGVGPGTTLGEAASIYGQPTLRYNINDESREYVHFPALSSSIMIRAGGPQGPSMAGEYDPVEAEVFETTRYNPSAQIWMVMVGRY